MAQNRSQRLEYRAGPMNSRVLQIKPKFFEMCMVKANRVLTFLISDSVFLTRTDWLFSSILCKDHG